MDPVVFRPVQRRKFLRIAAISAPLVPLAAAVIAIDGRFGGALLLVVGGVALGVATITLNYGCGRTVLSPDGIWTGSLFSRHFCRWPDVTAVEVKIEYGRGNKSSWIVVTRASGKRFKLAAPFNTFRDDPQFGIKFEQIRQYWTLQQSRLRESQ